MQRSTTGILEQPTEMAADLTAFATVMEALEQYTGETGTQPLMLGGWEVEHPAITPPPDLVYRLSECSVNVRRYAYARDLLRVRAQAAELLGDALRFVDSSLSARHISIQQNSTQALLLTLAALKERGARRVIIAAPAYYAVAAICQSLSLETVVVAASDFLTGALDISRLRDAARFPGAVVLVTNPAYSLGVQYTPAEISALSAALPSDAWLLLDETRLGLSWHHNEPWSCNTLSPRAVVVRSPSKVFFIHGRKISLLLGDPSLLREVERLGEALVGSLAGDIESVALAYLESWRQWQDETARGSAGPMSRWHRTVTAAFRQNLAAARTALKPAGFSFSPVDSGPYVLAAAPREHLPCLKPMAAARQQGVLLMDARYFFHMHPDWRGFRINLCGDPRHLVEAFARLCMLW